MSIINMFGFDSHVWILVLIGGIAIGIVLVLRYIGRNDDYWKRRGVSYAPRPGIISFIQSVRAKPLSELILEGYQQYGRVSGSFELSTPQLIVGDPDLLRDILVKDFHIFSSRRDMKMGDPIVDKMVSILHGEDWKRVRTVITPAFTSKRMRQMGSIINYCSKSVLETCEKHFQKGEPMNCKATFGAFTMDVIASAAFATKIDSHNDSENIFVKKAQEVLLQFSFFRFLLNMFIPIWVFKRLGLESFRTTEFFRDVTLQVIKERKQKAERYNDVLQILMDALDENKQSQNSELNEDEEDHFGSITDNGIQHQFRYKSITEDELLAQCVLFFFVGYETTASMLSFMAYALALNPEWQEKLIEEVDATFRKHSEMSYDTVREMKILDAVVSETLRRYPSVLLAERTALQDYKLGETGITVEKGMRIAFPIYAMHQDPEFFEEPETFDPNRFLDASGPKHPQYAYLPFGAGPRNCLGMRLALLEIKLCMSNLLRHYKFRKHSSTKVPLDYNKGVGFLTVDNLPLTIEKRTDVQTSAI